MGGRKEVCDGGEINSFYECVVVIVFKTGIDVFCKEAEEKSQESPSKTSCFLPNESSGSHLSETSLGTKGEYGHRKKQSLPGVGSQKTFSEFAFCSPFPFLSF